MCTFTEELPSLYPSIRRHACRLAGDRDYAEDLVQNTVLKAYMHRVEFRGESSLYTWVFSIMRRIFFTERIKDTRQSICFEKYGAAEIITSTTDVLDDLLDEEERLTAERQYLRCAQLLMQLPENQCRVITLIAIEEKSYEAVSHELGIPIGTVKSRINRGYATLRKLAQGEMHYRFPRYSEKSGRSGFYLLPIH